jgi:hypothetical protein
MPYICLARTDIPDGSVQILDLQPNTSQPKPPYAKGQTKYVNYMTLGTAAGALTTALDTQTVGMDIAGLTAFLLDYVQIGSFGTSSARLDLSTNPSGGDVLTFTTAAGAKTITFVTPGPAVADQVLIGINSAATVANLVTFLNNAGNRTAYDGVLGFHFVADATGVVNGLDIFSSATGPQGCAAISGDVPAWFGGNGGGESYATNRTRLVMETMSAGQLARIVANVQLVLQSALDFNDMGTIFGMYNPSISCTAGTQASMVITCSEEHGLVDGDAVQLQFSAGAHTGYVTGKDWVIHYLTPTTFSVDFNNSGANVSGTGYVTFADFTIPVDLLPSVTNSFPDFMKVVSGTGYELLSGAQTYTPFTVAGPITVPVKTAPSGSFTFVDTSRGTGSPNPSVNPITVTLPVKPTRATYQTAAFNMSITAGTLKKLTDTTEWNLHANSYMTSDSGVTGWATTLAGAPIRSYPYQGARANLKNGFVSETPGVNAQIPIRSRLVTVYTDDGYVMV